MSAFRFYTGNDPFLKPEQLNSLCLLASLVAAQRIYQQQFVQSAVWLETPHVWNLC